MDGALVNILEVADKFAARIARCEAEADRMAGLKVTLIRAEFYAIARQREESTAGGRGQLSIEAWTY